MATQPNWREGGPLGVSGTWERTARTRALRGFRGLMEGPAADAELARWLQEERAGVSLTENEVQAIVDLHCEELWRQDMCVKGNVTYSPVALQDLRAMVEIVAEAAVEKLVESGNIVDKAPHKVITAKKYILWWMQPSRVWGFMMRESEALAPSVAPPRPVPTTTGVEIPTPSSETDAPTSKTAIEDMRIQGVSSV